MAEVTIYYTVFEDVLLPIHTDIIEALPPPITHEILSYQKQDDINRLTAGKYLLKKSIEDHGFSSELFNQYTIDENGKPFISGFSPFNISHSGNVVACAVMEVEGLI